MSSKSTPLQKESRREIDTSKAERQREYVDHLERFASECIAAFSCLADATKHPDAEMFFRQLKEDHDELKRLKKQL